MNLLPGLIACWPPGQPAVAVLDDAVDDADEEHVVGAVDDGFEGGEDKEGTRDCRGVFVDHPVGEASKERSRIAKRSQQVSMPSKYSFRKIQAQTQTATHSVIPPSKVIITTKAVRLSLAARPRIYENIVSPRKTAAQMALMTMGATKRALLKWLPIKVTSFPPVWEYRPSIVELRVLFNEEMDVVAMLDARAYQYYLLGCKAFTKGGSRLQHIEEEVGTLCKS